MSKLLQLKQRKKTIDTIYRASCAMKAAANMRFRKLDKIVKEYEQVSNILHEEEIIYSSLTYLIMNKNNSSKAKILIGCNKGMCSDFVNIFTNYYKKNKESVDYWFFFGTKLEYYASAKLEQRSPDKKLAKNLFCGPCESDQFFYFNKVEELLQNLLDKGITSLVLVYVGKNGITEEVLYSKDKLLSIYQNDDIQKKMEGKYLSPEFAKLLMLAKLQNALYKSSQIENQKRIAAMTQAQNNAQTMAQMIGRLYNKARQEKITTELSEITVSV